MSSIVDESVIENKIGENIATEVLSSNLINSLTFEEMHNTNIFQNLLRSTWMCLIKLCLMVLKR